ncbi:MAG: Crp/Fnr family transcriptional regulator [Caulobacteraceae bacterium]
MNNRLLQLMSPSDHDALRPHLEHVILENGFIFAEPQRPITAMYFLEGGVASVVAVGAKGPDVEVGIFGREGILPIGAYPSLNCAPFKVSLQIGGGSWRIEKAKLDELCDARGSLRHLLLAWTHCFGVQAAYSARSNAIHTATQRLARSLLMYDDRCEGELPLTHEFLSARLAVRRPTITTSLHELEGAGLIRNERACINVRDRRGLVAFAGEAYGVPEAEYERLLGPLWAAN